MNDETIFRLTAVPHGNEERIRPPAERFVDRDSDACRVAGEMGAPRIEPDAIDLKTNEIEPELPHGQVASHDDLCKTLDRTSGVREIECEPVVEDVDARLIRMLRVDLSIGRAGAD